TNTEWAPWTVVRSNDKKRGRLEAMRWVLSQFEYTDKDLDIVHTPDPLIVGPPSQVYEHGERTATQFPPL
ncbi:MAG: polyphosphate kinase 2, partial [Actinomycetes bacterium]